MNTKQLVRFLRSKGIDPKTVIPAYKKLIREAEEAGDLSGARSIRLTIQEMTREIGGL